MANTKAAAVITALERLERALSDGQQQYFERSDGGRQAVKTQLIAIEEFISTVFEPSKTQPLCALLSELDDLDRGVAGTIVEPEPFKGRAPDSTDREITKVQSSLTVQMLLDVGVPLKDAVEEVVKVLIECGVTFGGRDPDPRRIVKQWRYELNKALRRDPENEKVKTYRSLLTTQDEFVKKLRHQIEHSPPERREAKRDDVRNQILFMLCVALMWAGDASRPADAVNARWEVFRAKLERETSRRWPALRAEIEREQEAYLLAKPGDPEPPSD